MEDDATTHDEHHDLTEKLTPEQTQQAVAGRRKTKGKAAVAKLGTTLERLKIEYVPVDQIRANTYNPNRQSDHDFELLCRSIEEDGFTQPTLLARDGTIIDGEHRWRAAIVLGYTEIPCVRMDMDPAQARVATIRHNRARGSHDIELEAEVLKDLQKLGVMDWAADALMISDDELNRMLEDFTAADALAGDTFTEAWTPERQVHWIGNAAEAGGEHVGHDGALTSLSAAAVEAKLAQEKALEKARSQEERDMIRKDDTNVRIVCAFTGEEGAIVKAVLGPRPAEGLLRLCREEMERTGGTPTAEATA